MEKISPEKIERRFSGAAIVAASGPSLTPEIAEQCRALPCVAVNDAYRMLPFARVLYAADLRWWEHHNGCMKFEGEKFVPFTTPVKMRPNVARGYKLRVIEGRGAMGFSRDQSHINYGGVLGTGRANSGIQAVNLALLLGWHPLILVGFDMRIVEGKEHFFGKHPKPLMQKQNFNGWIAAFNKAAETLAEGVQILNATPASALQCFPMVTLADAIKEAAYGSEADRAA